MQLAVPADQLVAIDVVLGRPSGVYRPGDRLTGYVIIDAKQDIPLCGMLRLVYTFMLHLRVVHEPLLRGWERVRDRRGWIDAGLKEVTLKLRSNLRHNKYFHINTVFQKQTSNARVSSQPAAGFIDGVLPPRMPLSGRLSRFGSEIERWSNSHQLSCRRERTTAGQTVKRRTD